ncbi:hypothetical protein GQ54DRAFT_77488 [Martensiomyces pterosporus]|nr:hypothetical protein GQ54DRAFT_77488 [Martensiomyces pterosporus]
MTETHEAPAILFRAPGTVGASWRTSLSVGFTAPTSVVECSSPVGCPNSLCLGTVCILNAHWNIGAWQMGVRRHNCPRDSQHSRAHVEVLHQGLDFLSRKAFSKTQLALPAIWDVTGGYLSVP